MYDTRNGTSFQAEPYLVRTSKNGVTQYEGYIADLVQAISDIVQFEYEWRPQRRIGRYKAKKRKWSGMLGDLQNDVSLSLETRSLEARLRHCSNLFFGLGNCKLYHQENSLG